MHTHAHVTHMHTSHTYTCTHITCTHTHAHVFRNKLKTCLITLGFDEVDLCELIQREVIESQEMEKKTVLSKHFNDVRCGSIRIFVFCVIVFIL